MSGYWGSFKSVTYNACPPLTPAIHGTVTAHPISVRHNLVTGSGIPRRYQKIGQTVRVIDKEAAQSVQLHRKIAPTILGAVIELFPLN